MIISKYEKLLIYFHGSTIWHKSISFGFFLSSCISQFICISFVYHLVAYHLLQNEDVRVHNSQKSNVWYVHERHNDSLGSIYKFPF